MIQLLLLLYSTALLTLALKIKRKSLWATAAFTVTAFILNAIKFLISPVLAGQYETGAFSLLFQVFGFPFIFVMLPLYLVAEAALTRHRSLIVLASISVFISALFVVLFSMSNM